MKKLVVLFVLFNMSVRSAVGATIASLNSQLKSLIGMDITFCNTQCGKTPYAPSFFINNYCGGNNCALPEYIDVTGCSEKANSCGSQVFSICNEYCNIRPSDDPIVIPHGPACEACL